MFVSAGGGGGCCRKRALPSLRPPPPPFRSHRAPLRPPPLSLLPLSTSEVHQNPPSHIKNKTKNSPTTHTKKSRRIELVQDLGFPAAAHRLKLSPDGQFLFATGTHAPRVRVYELSQLSMKFERHFDAEVVDFQILGEDYGKCAFLCADRSVQLHARYGAHHRVRVPRAGRDLAFSPRTADLVVAASAPELYRLNLGEGRFLAPLASASPAVNAVALCPAHGLLASAGEGGGLELFDLRARRAAGWLPDAAALAARGSGGSGRRGGGASAGADLTAVRSDERGLTLAVGTSAGHVALFDLRSPLPLLTKDLMYGSPVVDLKFHGDAAAVRGGGGGGADAFVSDFDDDGDGERDRGGGDSGDDEAPFSASPSAASSAHSSRVISADRHAVKIWSASDGRAHTSLQLPAPSSAGGAGGAGGEAAGAINDVLVWPGRGLVMVAGETPVVHSFFVPSLGPAPRWCSFLEALTEELEEATTSGSAEGGANPPQTVYDDFRFVTAADLDSHGLRHLLGTPALRPYMHGYFVHNRLWQRAAAAAGSIGAGGGEGEDYEASRRRRVEAKLEAARASRIAKVAKLPKVNAALAARALAAEEGEAGGDSGGSEEEDEGGTGAGKGGGARAKAAASAAAAARRLLADDRFAAMFRDEAFAVDEASEEYKLLHPNASEASARAKRLLREHFDSVEGGGGGGDGEAAEESESERGDGGSDESEGDDGESDSDASSSSDDDESRAPPAQRQRRMFAAKDAASAAAFGAGVSLAADRKVPLAARAAAAEAKGLGGARAWASGSREATFIPRSGGRGRGGGGGGGRGRGGGGGGFRGGGGGGRGRGGGRR